MKASRWHDGGEEKNIQGRGQGHDREYTINLHKCLHECTFKKMAPKAIKEIRKFDQKSMGKIDVRLDVKLNNAV